MNHTYEIIWAVVAENDLKEIIEYIQQTALPMR